MADEDNPDRLLSEPPETTNQHERTGSMSFGAPPNVDDVSPINGDSANDIGNGNGLGATTVVEDSNAKIVHEVVNSEIGVSTLLNRLKQSIVSSKEFAVFLKSRSKLEEQHSDGLKKLCRITSESSRKADQRHGTFLTSYEEVTQIHERMADNGAQFAVSLSTMHDDLLSLVLDIDRQRKQWKTTGLQNEQRVADAEASMRKSKSKYDALAEDYDRARTGGHQAGKKFGLKGPKSAAQHEEDLLKKVQTADSLYSSQVKQVQVQRDELWTKSRPEAVKAIQQLIRELDSATTLQMQKFASFNEKLLLSNALNVSPMKGTELGGKTRSLREAVHAINNDQDLSNYLTSFASKVPSRVSEIRYERNPVFNAAPIPQQTTAPPPQRQSDPAASYGSRQQGAHASFGVNQSPHQSHMSQPFNPGPQASMQQQQQHERSASQGQPLQQYGVGPSAGMGRMGIEDRAGSMGMGPPPRGGPPGSAGGYNNNTAHSGGPPQISTLPFQTSKTPPPMFQQQNQPSTAQSSYAPSPIKQNAPQLPPPVKPVFGLSLQQLFERDESAVPMIVYQCIQAIDLFGLEQEGLYRLSGTQSQMQTLKAAFDNDASKVDFRNPENFNHDVNSVAGLLKQFFRDLPDPLLTAEHYAGFVGAAKHEDDVVRRDSLHAIINALPDPNYATLRALTLHLNRVSDLAHLNRMTVQNLAIVFGPTLMGANTGPNIQDAGWQVKVVETILNNTYQIFDDD